MRRILLVVAAFLLAVYSQPVQAQNGTAAANAESFCGWVSYLECPVLSHMVLAPAPGDGWAPSHGNCKWCYPSGHWADCHFPCFLSSANPDAAKQIYYAAMTGDVDRLLELRSLAPAMITASIARNAIQVRNACDPQIIVASFPVSKAQLQVAMQPADIKRSVLSGLAFSGR